jgi:hypothetical protein
MTFTKVELLAFTVAVLVLGKVVLALFRLLAG